MNDETKRHVWLVLHHPGVDGAGLDSAWSTKAAAEARREALRIEKGCVGQHRPWCTEVVEMEVQGAGWRSLAESAAQYPVAPTHGEKGELITRGRLRGTAGFEESGSDDDLSLE